MMRLYKASNMEEGIHHNNKSVSVFSLWGMRSLFIMTLCLIIWKSVEATGPSRSIPHLDKVLHFGAYAILCFIALKSRLFKNAILAVMFVIAVGLLMETFQGVMGIGRTASLADFIANSCGAIVSFLIWRRYTIT